MRVEAVVEVARTRYHPGKGHLAREQAPLVAHEVRDVGQMEASVQLAVVVDVQVAVFEYERHHLPLLYQKHARNAKHFHAAGLRRVGCVGKPFLRPYVHRDDERVVGRVVQHAELAGCGVLPEQFSVRFERALGARGVVVLEVLDAQPEVEREFNAVVGWGHPLWLVQERNVVGAIRQRDAFVLGVVAVNHWVRGQRLPRRGRPNVGPANGV